MILYLKDMKCRCVVFPQFDLINCKYRVNINYYACSPCISLTFNKLISFHLM